MLNIQASVGQPGEEESRGRELGEGGSRERPQSRRGEQSTRLAVKLSNSMLTQVEERRIRGNRRRSRRSRGTDLTEQKYKVDNPSALLWTGKKIFY